jgi:cold shock CspA family protein
MAKSQQSFNKREKEKKRLKRREEKQKKKEARKAEAKESGGGIPFAYVDRDGRLTDTPPDKTEREEVELESIEISVPKKIEEEFDPIRKGKVSFFDHSKGFGFIIDAETQEKYFCHISGLIDEIEENDKVTFELEKGLKGLNAVKVTLQS